MTIDKIDITATIKQVKELLRTEQGLSPALKASLERRKRNRVTFDIFIKNLDGK
jgi:hypothetical protein